MQAGKARVQIALQESKYGTLLDSLPLNSRAIARLSALLHELIHAYLCVDACMRVCVQVMSIIE
jgi:hypothetical protein